jgi:hypothetical protein
MPAGSTYSDLALGVKAPLIKAVSPLLAFLSGVSGVGSSHLAQAEHSNLEFEVRGMVSWEDAMAARAARAPEDYTPDEYSFRVVVNDGQWQIALLPVNVAPKETLIGKIPVKTSYLMSSDGTNVYQVSRYRREDLPDWQVEQFAERWKGSLPMERGSHREAHALWYAFASSGYCGKVSGHSFMTLEPRYDPTVTGMMVRNERFPGLPVHILATNAANTHHWQYKVMDLTNHLGLSLPLRGVVDAYVRPLERPWSRVRFVVHQVLVPSPGTEFSPALGTEARSVVYDTTHRNDVVPFTARFLTNQWPDDNTVQAARRLHAIPRSSVPSSGGARRRAVALALLATLLGGPLLVAAWYFAAGRKRSRETK